MNRGMVPLTADQIHWILSLPQDTFSPMLPQKLTAAHAEAGVVAPEPVQVEVSEQELEEILDLLPVPTANDPAVVLSVRQTLSAALSKIRFGDQT